MDINAILNAAIAKRVEQGLGLAVHGLPDRPAHLGPFTCYATSEEQRNKWIAKYQAMGCRVDVILPKAN